MAELMHTSAYIKVKGVMYCHAVKGMSSSLIIFVINTSSDHLCGILVRVPGYRPRGSGSISSATRFEK
jgi:hypothetical protein